MPGQVELTDPWLALPRVAVTGDPRESSPGGMPGSPTSFSRGREGTRSDPEATAHQDRIPSAPSGHLRAFLGLPSRARGRSPYAAPGAGSSLLQAGGVLELSFGCTGYWHLPQCPHTTAGHKSASNRVEFHSFPCLASFFPSSHLHLSRLRAWLVESVCLGLNPG